MCACTHTHTHTHTHTCMHACKLLLVLFPRLTQRLFYSVFKLCPTLCDPMDCSTPAFPVLHHLPEFPQTHVHWVTDTIQPSHPLLPASPPALNLSQHQGLLQWVSSLNQVASIEASASASILLIHIHGWFPLWLTGLISLLSKGFSGFSSTTVGRHQFFGAQLSHL